MGPPGWATWGQATPAGTPGQGGESSEVLPWPEMAAWSWTPRGSQEDRARRAIEPTVRESLLAEQGVNHPAAPDVRPRPPQVGEGLLIVAAGLFESVGHDRQQVDRSIVVDRADKTHDSSGPPPRIGSHEAEGNRAEDTAEHPSLGSALRRPDQTLVVGTTGFPGKAFGSPMSRTTGTISRISGWRRSVPSCPGCPTDGRIRIGRAVSQVILGNEVRDAGEFLLAQHPVGKLFTDINRRAIRFRDEMPGPSAAGGSEQAEFTIGGLVTD